MKKLTITAILLALGGCAAISDEMLNSVAFNINNQQDDVIFTCKSVANRKPIGTI